MTWQRCSAPPTETTGLHDSIQSINLAALSVIFEQTLDVVYIFFSKKTKILSNQESQERLIGVHLPFELNGQISASVYKEKKISESLSFYACFVFSFFGEFHNLKLTFAVCGKRFFKSLLLSTSSNDAKGTLCKQCRAITMISGPSSKLHAGAINKL